MALKGQHPWTLVRFDTPLGNDTVPCLLRITLPMPCKQDQARPEALLFMAQHNLSSQVAKNLTLHAAHWRALTSP